MLLLSFSRNVLVLPLLITLIAAFPVWPQETPAAGRAPILQGDSPQEPPPEGSSEEEGETKEGDKEDAKKAEEKPFDEVVKDMEKIEGLFTFHRNPEENKVFIEIMPEQIGKDFLYSSKIEQATGERGLYATIMMDSFVFQWRRLGKRIQFVKKNTRFRAAPGSPAARAVKTSFSDSILSSGKIAGKPHLERKSVLVDLHEIFASRDLHAMGQGLKRRYKTSYKFDKTDSGIAFLKSFPKNSEIGALIHFQAEEVKQPSMTIPDQRTLTLTFRYSLVELPENDYMPRFADDRVGHFLDQYMDFTSDKPDTPYVRYITRWKLEKKDPNAEVSEPKEPIVFWLENSIPHEYRDWFREGILLWNPAFERAGFKNAIVVKQQPDGAEWDPADIRYNTIRWLVGVDASFAIGPSHSNPYSGQKIDADIGISEGIMRFSRRRYELSVHPVQQLERIKHDPLESRWGYPDSSLRYFCDYGDGLVEQASFAYDVMATRPGWDPAKEKEFVRQYALHLLAHEVGHTLGLRHNFRASTINRADQLANTGRTHKVGLAASVMDYNPPIIALPGEKQGDYFPIVVGAYDQWVIEYAYKPIPVAKTSEDELPELRKIASRVADPLLPYGTDEDAGMGPRALDPRSTRGDFTDKPLDWFEHQFKLIRELWSNMESKLLRTGESYEVLRRAFNRTWSPYFRSSHVAMKYIGGIYHHRDHAGDPGGQIPYVPVPAEEQRKALAFLAEKVWAPDVFEDAASLLQKLQFERFPTFDWANFRNARLDYPLHESALRAQGEVLNDLYDPIKLSRIQDIELMHPDPNDRFTMADLFTGVSDALWSELGEPSRINSFRRNLQREHLKQLLQLTVKPKEGTPGDAVALARADLTDLDAKITRAVTVGEIGYSTRAHLLESQARIRQALEAHVERVLFEEPKKDEP